MTNPEEPQPRRWVSRKTAAGYLDCHVTSLWRLVQAGKVSAYEITPGMTRYDLDEIDAMVKAARIQQGRADAE